MSADKGKNKYSYFFIELYSGSEMWSQNMRSRGYRVYSFDVCQGPRGDLLRRGVRSRVLRMLRSGMCLGLLAGVPCTSFTRALRQPIRSTASPGGLPDLKASDHAGSGGEVCTAAPPAFTAPAANRLRWPLRGRGERGRLSGALMHD